jgi:hypothetical protein
MNRLALGTGRYACHRGLNAAAMKNGDGHKCPSPRVGADREVAPQMPDAF